MKQLWIYWCKNTHLRYFKWKRQRVENVSKCLHLYLLFSRSVVSHSLWPHGLQHARLPCPSATPAAYSNSCPLSWWCHPAISPSVIPFSSCLQSFPASGSFPGNWLFTSGGKSIGATASASILPMNIQGWFPLGWTGLFSFQFRDSKESSTPQFKSINSSVLSLIYGPTVTSIYDYWKNHSFDYMDLGQQSNVCFLIHCLGLS